MIFALTTANLVYAEDEASDLLIVELRDDVSFFEMQEIIKDEIPKEVIEEVESLENIESIKVKEDEIAYEPLNICAMEREKAQLYIDAGLVVSYTENVKFELNDSTSEYVPNDAFYSGYQEYFKTHNIDKLKAVYGSGEGVRIAVIDTGVNISHPDLEGANIVDAYNVLDPKKPQDVTDNVNHGTGVVGLIAARENNSIGVAGIASSATIVPIKVMDDKENGSLDDILKGLNYAIQKECKIINMSLGSYTASAFVAGSPFQNAIDDATSKGFIIFASAGNNGEKANGNAYNYPASSENVIGVGSVGYPESNQATRILKRFLKTPISNYNDKVDVMATGGYVLYLKNDGTYGAAQGTSYASPMAAAIAAILVSHHPDLTHDDMMEIIKASSIDAGDSGYDNYFGYGVMDGYAAYEFLQNKQQVFIAPVYKDDYDIDKKAAKDKVTFNLKVYGKMEEATLVYHIYDQNNNLIEICQEEVVLEPSEEGKEEMIGYVQTSEMDKNQKIKIFLFKDLENLKPLVEFRS